MERATVDCVGGVVVDEAGRFLMVRRGTEPALGLWSLPGGKVEPGESDAEALAREVLEETGLRVVVGDLIGSVELDGADGAVALVRDYRCTPQDGTDLGAVRAGDDAADVGWFTAEELQKLSCSPNLLATLDAWGVFPQPVE